MNEQPISEPYPEAAEFAVAANTQMSVLGKIRFFTAALDRQDFYDFYAVMTAMAGPSCGDHVMVGGQLLNLKKIVRRLRITVMSPRFNVDYAPVYTQADVNKDLDRLVGAYPSVSRVEERQSIAKLIGALRIIAEALR